MGKIPHWIADLISDDLDHIRSFFKSAKVTVIVRSPQLADGDFIMTDDDPEAVIASIRKTARLPALPTPQTEDQSP